LAKLPEPETMKLKGWIRLLLVGAVLAGLMTAGAWSIRTGWADYQARRQTLAGAEEAVAFAPDNADYSAALAAQVPEDDPRRATLLLRRSVSLNPLFAQSWIDLGLTAEREGDRTTAQICLLRAADADLRFLPRWTLANYYFRHDDRERFWYWAKEALAMAYGAVQPMFRLCGRVEEDGRLVDRLGIRNPEVRAGYLYYLLSRNRVDLIGPAVRRLLEDNREADVPLLLSACERFLEALRVNEAVDLWERLASSQRVPFRTRAGRGEQLLANNSFTTPPTSRGFDWRISGAEGISVSREGEAGGLRLTFSGSEPEDCEALVQLSPVQGGMEYELRSEHQTDGIAKGAGLGWQITDASGGALLGEGPILAPESNAGRQLRFQTPLKCRLIRLALKYHRAPGTTRMEGFLALQTVSLHPAGQAPVEGTRVRK
jgi:tetratricopeptide (TPR) repeat protein